MSRINPNSARDMPWCEALRALARRPHKRTQMLAMNDRGPLRSWYCPLCSSAGSPITTQSLSTEAPICFGSNPGYRGYRPD